jgi:hypothetical protein
MNFELSNEISLLDEPALPEQEDKSTVAEKIDISNVLVFDQLLIDFGASEA